MESIVAAYGSSSESDDAVSVSSEGEVEGCTLTAELAGDGDAQVGTKRKRSDEPQWKRAFPHVDGNWPSHVRINIPVTKELRELAKRAIDRAQELVDDTVVLIPFKELGLGESPSTISDDGLHLSLSRPFVLTYDQIEGFVDSLRAALKWRQCFSVTLRRPLVLVNDDRSRSFLALRVGEGEQQFIQVLRCVDQCLARLELPTYYKDPIPHVSIASSLGEELAQLTPDQCESLLTPRQETIAMSSCLTAGVAAVHVDIGNKHYDIPLR
ncbi:U6 snRNA phosphodiesterase [Phytophthora cinnamomi]|uniref:U6 snRNA phosphodiesterase n=1 Tax=Phytophthora cinnamomi TaxID=4785 RepID=UPI00355A862E|nr:U6 snRNA phosphodiesterase [Phytophthora cinnamomi]